MDIRTSCYPGKRANHYTIAALATLYAKISVQRRKSRDGVIGVQRRKSHDGVIGVQRRKSRDGAMVSTLARIARGSWFDSRLQSDRFFYVNFICL